MAETIETLLREAAKRGMTHLSVYPVHSADNKTIYWHAKASPSTERTGVSANGLDIVAVVTEALTTMPKAPLRKAREPDMIDRNRGHTDPDQNEITAAVKEPPAEEPASTPENEIDRWLPRT